MWYNNTVKYKRIIYYFFIFYTSSIIDIHTKVLYEVNNISMNEIKI
jgi:hypothetical protein